MVRYWLGMGILRPAALPMAGLAFLCVWLSACSPGATGQSTGAPAARAAPLTSQAAQATPSPMPSATPSPAPAPAASAGGGAAASPAPVRLPAAPAQPPRAVADSWRVVIIPPTRTITSLVLEVVNSRGLVIGACYNVLLVNVANPLPPAGGAPPPSPTTYRQSYQRCGDYLQVFINDYWGGSWSLTGTATVNGRTAPVSGSGTVSYP